MDTSTDSNATSIRAAAFWVHGWPYDIHSFVDVAPLLAAQGYRVLGPYERGCGATTFLSSATFRNGQQGAIALDAIAFLDALKIDKAVIGGFDWGGRTADILAANWPERCKALVSVSGYLIGSPAATTSNPRRRRLSTSGGAWVGISPRS